MSAKLSLDHYPIELYLGLYFVSALTDIIKTDFSHSAPRSRTCRPAHTPLISSLEFYLSTYSAHFINKILIFWSKKPPPARPNTRRPNLVWIIVRLRLFVYRLCFRSNRPTKCWTTKLSLDHCPIRFVLGLDFYFRSNRPTKCWTTVRSSNHCQVLFIRSLFLNKILILGERYHRLPFLANLVCIIF